MTHIPQRWDEQGRPYQATADDAVYRIFEVEGGAIVQLNSSWAVRVHRDELVEFQVDGTEGSAVAGLFSCVAQHRSITPKPVWNPDLPETRSYRAQWQEVPDNAPSRTVSGLSGNSSCGTSPGTASTRTTSSPEPAGCGWPRPGWPRQRRASGSS